MSLGWPLGSTLPAPWPVWLPVEHVSLTGEGCMRCFMTHLAVLETVCSLPAIGMAAGCAICVAQKLQRQSLQDGAEWYLELVSYAG